MKRITKILVIFSALVGLSLLVRIPTERISRLISISRRTPARRFLGLTAGYSITTLLIVPKIVGGIFAPFIAIAGALGALLSTLYHDYFGALAGLFGAGMTAWHTFTAARDHDGFQHAFGMDWQSIIPAQLWSSITHRRWHFPLPRRSHPGVRVTKDLVFGSFPKTGAPLYCDLWEPPQSVEPTGLAAVYLHFGPWANYDKGMGTGPIFRRLAGQGHLIMDVAYTRAPEANLKEMIGDVKRAIEWLKHNAEIYGIDPERVVLWGSSGGGHLALLSAYTPNHPHFQPAGMDTDTSVRGVIATCAVTDMAAWFNTMAKLNWNQPEYSNQVTEDMQPFLHNRTAIDRFLTNTGLFPAYRYNNEPNADMLLIKLVGGTLKETPEAYELASPIYHAGTGSPPTLYIIGKHDFYIFEGDHGERLHEKLRQAKVPSIFVEYPHAEHGFEAYGGLMAPAAQAATHDIERFLALMV